MGRECRRCGKPINVCDFENVEWRIDGGNLFCDDECKSYYQMHIPVNPAKVCKKKEKVSNVHKVKKIAIFKCYSCEGTLHYMPWNKKCPTCSANGVNDGTERMFKL